MEIRHATQHHGNEDLFLTIDDVDATEREANRGVIVIDIPDPQ
jgi:hypothetical protein